MMISGFLTDPNSIVDWVQCQYGWYPTDTINRMVKNGTFKEAEALSVMLAAVACMYMHELISGKGVCIPKNPFCEGGEYRSPDDCRDWFE